MTDNNMIQDDFLKQLFARQRPCNVLDNVRLLVGCSRSFSMPSSHAGNNFAAATFFGILYKRYSKILFTIATLVAFSRPYVGVHYPSDIIVGSFVGIVIGFVFAYFIKRIII